ncbi:hypothetical protein HOY82DRAFT_574251 [Tuber indicum]|nr:hypothetical protein HOY82DRAFT_574251 [Tuber indicum]
MATKNNLFGGNWWKYCHRRYSRKTPLLFPLFTFSLCSYALPYNHHVSNSIAAFVPCPASNSCNFAYQYVLP